MTPHLALLATAAIIIVLAGSAPPAAAQPCADINVFIAESDECNGHRCQLTVLLFAHNICNGNPGSGP